MALGRGQSLSEAQSGIHQVVEGLPAARAVYEVENLPHHAGGQAGSSLRSCGPTTANSA
jgi:hypothetical protein